MLPIYSQGKPVDWDRSSNEYNEYINFNLSAGTFYLPSLGLNGEYFQT